MLTPSTQGPVARIRVPAASRRAEAPRRWEARQGGEVVGTLVAWVRPDGRCFLFLSDCAPGVYGSLLDLALGEPARDLCLEGEATDELTERGFVVHRREHLYALPTSPTACRASPTTRT
jgi:hypothetical protein